MTRHFPFEAIENFRDYGDYAARGGRLKRGRLYRSASHARATDADLEALAELGISTVVDLRRKGERERQPSRRHAGFAAQVIECDVADSRTDTWVVFMKNGEFTLEGVRGYMSGYYAQTPREARHIELFRRYFRALGEGDGAMLIHCAAGKDRTGMLAALTHRLLGVHPDDIVADYLLTNLSARKPHRIERATAEIEKTSGRRPPPEAVAAAMGVAPEYLESAFASLTAEHGSVDRYISDVLGVDAPLHAAIEARLID